MKAKSLIVAAAVIGMTISGAAVASIATPTTQVTPIPSTIQLAEQESSENIQLAAKGRRTAFIAGALVGAAVAHGVTKSRARRGYYNNTPRRRATGSYQAAQDRCARKYRSYSYRTDTFVTYSGYEKLCPYVRPWY